MGASIGWGGDNRTLSATGQGTQDSTGSTLYTEIDFQTSGATTVLTDALQFATGAPTIPVNGSAFANAIDPGSTTIIL